MNRGTVTVSRWALERLDARLLGSLLDRETLIARLEIREALERPIPWEMVRPLIVALEAEGDPARSLAAAQQVDQLQAYATHRLGELDVDLRDPRVLYEAVAVLALVHQCAVNGHENEVLDETEAEAIRGMVRAIGAALGRLAPDEARS